MGHFKVYSSTERQQFWKDFETESSVFGSDKFREHIESEIHYTFCKEPLPYTKTIGNYDANGNYRCNVTANGKTISLTIRSHENQNIKIAKAVAKCFK